MVVAECTFSAIPIIKKVFDVPVTGVGIVPLTETSRDLAPPGLGLTPSYTFTGRMKQWFLRILTDRVFFRAANLACYEILDSYGIQHQRSNIFDINVKASDLYLQSGTPVLNTAAPIWERISGLSVRCYPMQPRKNLHVVRYPALTV